MSFQAWMQAIRERTATALDRRLPLSSHAPQRLHEAMRYACLNGGKRLRPILVHAAGEAAGAKPETLDFCAVAVEMIHVYSLVHDDMPCMDDDTLRRGQPTCHVEYDEATALLVGDALQTQAFITLADTPLQPATVNALIRSLAHAAGAGGMAGGQAIDLAAVGQQLDAAQLEQMHILKTGALIRAAIRMGGLAGESLTPEALEQLDRFGKVLGLLFQVVDDILDCTASTDVLGKTAGKDAASDKPTYVSLMGLSGARAFANDLLSQAQQLIAPLNTRANRLQEIALEIVRRTH
ncbi:MAG: polyprenyl synthetase family protein [Rhodocyclaceae bacterium]|nr:polyprenyl synthetase family protein [Rhodocyclaceae bacterium]